MLNERIEQAVGAQEARFECRIKANPLKSHYWMKDGIIIDNIINGVYTENSKNNEYPRPVFSSKNEFDYQYSNRLSHIKYDIHIHNMNSNDHSLVSALTIKVYICRKKYILSTYNKFSFL